MLEILVEGVQWWYRPGMVAGVLEIPVEVVLGTLRGVVVVAHWWYRPEMVVVALEIQMEAVPGTLREVGAPEFLEVVEVLKIQSSLVVGEERSSGCGLVQYTWCRWSWCL